MLPHAPHRPAGIAAASRRRRIQTEPRPCALPSGHLHRPQQRQQRVAAAALAVRAGAQNQASDTSRLLERGRHARVALPPKGRGVLAGAAAPRLPAQLADGRALRDKGSGNAVCLVAYQRHAGTGTTTTPVRGAATPSSVAESQSKGSQAWPTAAAAEEAAMTSSSAAATTSISDQAAAQRAATGTTETRSSCLPATASTSTAAASEHGRHQFSWLRRFVRADVQAGINGGYGDAGLVGAAICDTFGNLIPPRTLDPVRDGAFGCVQRQGYAYMSNVMVAPSCRRRGLALQLVAHAEQTAAAWGCEHMALHVHPSNTAAVTLYRRLRYKSVALEARWQPWVHGRGMEGRCLLMVKRLPHLAPKPQA